MSRPEKCSKCIWEDCMLTDFMAQSCEVTATLEGGETSLLESSIRTSQTNNGACPEIKGSIEVWEDTFGVVSGVVRSRRCGRWDCPVCGVKKVDKLRLKLKGALYSRFEEVQKRGETDGWKYLKFLTLTCYRDFDSPAAAYDVMAKGWNKLVTAMKKKHGTIEYFKVVEPHEDGYPHLHVLLWTKEYIPFAWIQKLWVKYEVGKFVNINNKTDKFQTINHVVNYITKYLTKYISKSVAWYKRWSKTRGFFKGNDRVKRWTGYNLYERDRVDWLYDDMEEAGYWLEWHKDKQGYNYCKN